MHTQLYFVIVLTYKLDLKGYIFVLLFYKLLYRKCILEPGLPLTKSRYSTPVRAKFIVLLKAFPSEGMSIFTLFGIFQKRGW